MKTSYNVTVSYTSKELSAKERISIKDTTNATPIDTAIDNPDIPLLISPDFYAVLKVHNEKAKDNPDYTKYVIVDKSGQKYVTGSESFFNAFSEIWEEMSADGNGEDFSIECYKRPSKNYKGKSFITCSIV